MSTINYAKRQMPVASIADIEEVASWFHASRMFGNSTNPAMCKIIALSLYQDGISPIEFKRRNDIVDGNSVSIKAKIKLADFLAIGGEYTPLTLSDEMVEIELAYKGRRHKFRTSIDDMVERGIATTKDGSVKTNYKRFGMKMLWSRCISEGVDIIAPESAGAGMYTTEERQDFEERNVPMIDATPVPEEYTLAAPQSVKVEVIEAPQQVIEDPSVCSIDCQFKGRRWEELSDNVLEKAVTLQNLSEETKMYIASVLVARHPLEEGEANE